MFICDIKILFLQESTPQITPMVPVTKIRSKLLLSEDDKHIGSGFFPSAICLREKLRDKLEAPFALEENFPQKKIRDPVARNVKMQCRGQREAAKALSLAAVCLHSLTLAIWNQRRDYWRLTDVKMPHVAPSRRANIEAGEGISESKFQPLGSVSDENNNFEASNRKCRGGNKPTTSRNSFTSLRFSVFSYTSLKQPCISLRHFIKTSTTQLNQDAVTVRDETHSRWKPASIQPA